MKMSNESKTAAVFYQPNGFLIGHALLAAVGIFPVFKIEVEALLDA